MDEILSHRPDLDNRIKAVITNIDKLDGRVHPIYTDNKGIPLYPYWSRDYSDSAYAFSLWTVITSYPDNCSWQEIRLSY